MHQLDVGTLPTHRCFAYRHAMAAWKRHSLIHRIVSYAFSLKSSDCQRHSSFTPIPAQQKVFPSNLSRKRSSLDIAHRLASQLGGIE